MTDQNSSVLSKVEKNLARRYRTEKMFQWFGILSIAFGVACLVVLMTDIFGKGHKAFQQSEIQLDITFDADKLDITDASDINQLNNANYLGVIKKSLKKRFPGIKKRKMKKALYGLISSAAEYDLRDQLIANPELLGTTQTLWLLADDDVDSYYKHFFGTEEVFARYEETQKGWIAELHEKEELRLAFNTVFFNAGDSREPEQAGIWGALMGSLFTLLVTLALSFPIGVATAIYLEEYAPQNRWTEILEVNINNLAAVPSIIFGLLGLAIFINLFEFQRSVPLVGGLVLTLMTLPTIIISSRAAIKAVPPSVREAALGIGASKTQTVMHHVLPLAMPGMLTGTIIGLSQALGETAPLLMIGMVAFIVDIPGGITDSATVLPVQIFLWSDSPERAFEEKTAAAIMVLLGFLIIMNTLAVFLRKRLERRW